MPIPPVGTIDRVPKYNNYKISALLFASMMFSGQTHAVEATSPDGQIVVALGLTAEGNPQYSVRYGDEIVIADSRLGLRFREHASIE